MWGSELSEETATGTTNGRAVLFRSPILCSSITEQITCNKQEGVPTNSSMHTRRVVAKSGFQLRLIAAYREIELGARGIGDDHLIGNFKTAVFFFQSRGENRVIVRKR